jgi:hypothetical protein
MYQYGGDVSIIDSVKRTHPPARVLISGGLLWLEPRASAAVRRMPAPGAAASLDIRQRMVRPPLGQPFNVVGANGRLVCVSLSIANDAFAAAATPMLWLDHRVPKKALLRLLWTVRWL